MDKKEILLLNDSFPPLIDGVANAVVNYASIIQKSPDYNCCVVTPENPEADDSAFPYQVIRYPGIDLRKTVGYVAGNPLNPYYVHELSKQPISLIHSHCPMASNLLARAVRSQRKVPLVLTYHSKFDVDFAKFLHFKPLFEGAVKYLVDSVSAADELWVVSRGAGESIKQLGYQGDYIVMENGVDLPKQKASQEHINEVIKGYDFPAGVPVFLFVGRLMWYKGIRIILDSLARLKAQNLDFRMVFIGGDGNEKEIKAYTTELNLDDKVFFTGKIFDRKQLVAWYSFANLFLFPSTYDTNGLVVREAAACSLGAVIVAGSCASEGITDGDNGLLIEENANSMTACLEKVLKNPKLMKEIGQRAADEIYISWDTAVHKAMDRYQIVIDNYQSGKYPKKDHLVGNIFTLTNDVIDGFEHIFKD